MACGSISDSIGINYMKYFLFSYIENGKRMEFPMTGESSDQVAAEIRARPNYPTHFDVVEYLPEHAAPDSIPAPNLTVT